MMAIVHIDDAVAATVAALTASRVSTNIVDDDPLPVAEWLPAFARRVNAPEPPRLSVDNALKIAGEEERASRISSVPKGREGALCVTAGRTSRRRDFLSPP